MKATRFFLLAILLLAFVTVLASCDMISGLFGGTTTTTGSDVTTTVDPGTTVTTTAPFAPSNPIASASSSSGELRIKYADGKSHNLGAEQQLYDGGNTAVLADYALDASGVLSLTFRDKAAYNTANKLLGETFRDVTIRLRENNGNLEWALGESATFTVLCPAKQISSEAEPLAKLVEAAGGLFSHDGMLGKGMIFTIKGTNLRFRATDWLDGLDFCNDATYTSAAKNRFFNLSYMRVINENLAHDDMSVGTTWKGATDDCTPLNINSTYIGANHGYNIIAKIPNPGKTEKDIGSVWENSAGQQFCLVRIVDGDIWLCPFDDDSMDDGNFSEYHAKQLVTAGTSFSHVKGATNKADFTSSVSNNTSDMQFYVAVNHVERHAFLDGVKEVNLLTDGTYEAEFVDFYECYDIIYLPAVLEHLMKYAGQNDNESHHDESIKEAYVTVKNTYRFHKNGSIVVYSDYEFKKDIPVLGKISGVQSGTLTSLDQYIYVPGTNNYAVPTKQNTSSATYIYNTNLVNPNVPVSSYFQMTDTLGTKAMNLGYCPTYGYAVPEKRLPLLKSALGFYHTSKKMYPHLISGGSLEEGDCIDFISYRIPSEATDSDFTAINWYWVGDDIYLSLHTTKAVAERKVDLPDYMDGMTISAVENSTSFTVSSETVAADGITVSSTGAGYTIVKLSPAN